MVDADPAASRDRLTGDDKHIEQQFDQVLAQQFARQVPRELRFVIFEEAPRDGLGIAEIDLGTGRSGSPERDTTELQFGRRRACTLLDEIEREFPCAVVFLFLEHLKSIDDGPYRADEIVAYPRAQQGGQIERFD